MKRISESLLTIGFLAAICSSEAVQITGSVDMVGTVILDSNFLGLADGATSFGSVKVGGLPSGAFAGTAGASVTWSAFDWDPSSAPVTPLWTYSVGPNTYRFDLNVISIDFQNNYFLNLSGAGVLSVTGYDTTPGLWSFTISNPTGGKHANFAFTFANSQTSVPHVPDGGATAMLLGLGFLGAAGLRRKLS